MSLEMALRTDCFCIELEVILLLSLICAKMKPFCFVRQDAQSLLDPQEVKMSIYHAYLRNETRKNLAHRIGKVKYSMTEYEKIKRITVPIGKDHLLLVSIDPNVEHTKIVNDILEMIANTPLT